MSSYLNVRIMSDAGIFEAMNVFDDLEGLPFLGIDRNRIFEELRKGLISDKIERNISRDVNIKIPINLIDEAPKGMERAEIKDILLKHDCVALLNGASRVMEEPGISKVYLISDIRKQDMLDRMRKKYGRWI